MRELGSVLRAVHNMVEVVLDVLRHIKVDKVPGIDQKYPRRLQEAEK